MEPRSQRSEFIHKTAQEQLSGQSNVYSQIKNWTIYKHDTHHRQPIFEGESAHKSCDPQKIKPRGPSAEKKTRREL